MDDGKHFAVRQWDVHALEFGVTTQTIERNAGERGAHFDALKACALDPDDRYAQTSLILAYHFNGRSGDRDALIRKAQQQADDSSGRAILQYGLDVISKKEKFRN